MPQGKLKPKQSLPKLAKNKTLKKKGNAVTKRANRPVPAKKRGIPEVQKMKQAISKAVNKSLEEEITARASNESKSLSNVQQAVAEHTKKTTKPT